MNNLAILPHREDQPDCGAGAWPDVEELGGPGGEVQACRAMREGSRGAWGNAETYLIVRNFTQ